MVPGRPQKDDRQVHSVTAYVRRHYYIIPNQCLILLVNTSYPSKKEGKKKTTQARSLSSCPSIRRTTERTGKQARPDWYPPPSLTYQNGEDNPPFHYFVIWKGLMNVYVCMQRWRTDYAECSSQCTVTVHPRRRRRSVLFFFPIFAFQQSSAHLSIPFAVLLWSAIFCLLWKKNKALEAGRILLGVGCLIFHVCKPCCMSRFKYYLHTQVSTRGSPPQLTMDDDT